MLKEVNKKELSFIKNLFFIMFKKTFFNVRFSLTINLNEAQILKSNFLISKSLLVQNIAILSSFNFDLR